jgi:hypothetical protein
MKSSTRQAGHINAPIRRPTSWWLKTLRRRAERMYEAEPDFSVPVEFDSDAEREACIAFFNAAFRAEESGHNQAHRLAEELRGADPELADTLVLYGDEEGWHRDLLTQFMEKIGGTVRPMGRVTRTFYRLYAAARDMETIMLTNLMFETIGSTTYRLAIERVRQPTVRAMLFTLMRDESFHVPLNVHFVREILARTGRDRLRMLKLRAIYHLVFVSLVASTVASRRVAARFDQLTLRELAAAYARNLALLFAHEPDLDLAPPWLLLRLLGIRRDEVDGAVPLTSAAAAEAAAERHAIPESLQRRAQ